MSFDLLCLCVCVWRTLYLLEYCPRMSLLLLLYCPGLFCLFFFFFTAHWALRYTRDFALNKYLIIITFFFKFIDSFSSVVTLWCSQSYFVWNLPQGQFVEWYMSQTSKWLCLMVSTNDLQSRKIYTADFMSISEVNTVEVSQMLWRYDTQMPKTSCWLSTLLQYC